MPDARQAWWFGPGPTFPCELASLGPFTCGVVGGPKGAGGEEPAGGAAEGDAAPAGGTEAGAPVGAAGEPASSATESEPGADLRPYGEGGGHHIPAKSAFRGDPNHDVNETLAIPNSELEAQGIRHPLVTGAQRSLYGQFAKTGRPLTWDDVRSIETQALIRGGMRPGSALVTVNKAISALQARGVGGPTRIPWGGN
jgi:hypothetical protein